MVSLRGSVSFTLPCKAPPPVFARVQHEVEGCAAADVYEPRWMSRKVLKAQLRRQPRRGALADSRADLAHGQARAERGGNLGALGQRRPAGGDGGAGAHGGPAGAAGRGRGRGASMGRGMRVMQGRGGK